MLIGNTVISWTKRYGFVWDIKFNNGYPYRSIWIGKLWIRIYGVKLSNPIKRCIVCNLGLTTYFGYKPEYRDTCSHSCCKEYYG